MKQPNYLDYCSDGIEELYAKLQDHLLKKVVKRILDFGEISDSSKYELEMLEQSGMMYDEIVQDVAAFLHTSDSMVRELFTEAQMENLAFDNSVIESAGQRPILETASPEVNQIVEAAISKTNGNLHNLTMTTADATQQKFIEACSLAEMEVSTGAFDVNTAIRHAIEHAIQDGVSVYYYNDETDDTKVTAKRNIVSAVRTAVLTGVSQTTGEISLKNAEKLGTDIMELSAHIGARPSHSVWQGRLVCISDRETEYLTLEDIGYGEPDGFKGINCRHYWFAFVEGVSERTYTDEELEEMNNATVTYNGVEMSVAEANSRQRAMERKIRAERSQLVALDNAIKEAREQGKDDVADDLQISFDNLAVKMKGHEAIYHDFCKETGLPVLNERLQYPAFNRSVSQKAIHAAKRNIADEDRIDWLPKGPNITVEQYKELREYAKERGITLSGFKKSDVDISLAKEFIDDTHRMLNKFPEMIDSKKPFTLELTHMLSADLAETQPGVNHVIKLNFDAMRNREKLAKEYDILMNDGRFVKGTDYHSIIYHEFGHLIASKYKLNVLGVVRNILHTKNTNYIITYIEKNLSVYGGQRKDCSEAFAEAFSAYESGVDNSFALQLLKLCGIIN